MSNLDKTWGTPTTQCRLCKKEINRSKETDFYERARGWTYHTECWNQVLAKRKIIREEGIGTAFDEFDIWYDLAYEYMTRDLKIKYDYKKAERQWKNFIKDGEMTSKGIYYALRYYYDIKKGDFSKANGGIGIVPYIYEDSCEYWVAREKRESGIVARIEKEAKEKLGQSPQIYSQKRKPSKPKKTIDLASIAQTEEEDS